MNPFKNLLVPTDFGEPSDAALELALQIAEKFGAKVTLLHTYSLPISTYASANYWPSDDIKKEAARALQALVDKTIARYRHVEGIVADGQTEERILEIARDTNADLIVMGTHGRTGLSRVLIGSVAESIVRTSPVPVLTVTAGEALEERKSRIEAQSTGRTS